MGTQLVHVAPTQEEGPQQRHMQENLQSTITCVQQPPCAAQHGKKGIVHCPSMYSIRLQLQYCVQRGCMLVSRCTAHETCSQQPAAPAIPTYLCNPSPLCGCNTVHENRCIHARAHKVCSCEALCLYFCVEIVSEFYRVQV